MDDTCVFGVDVFVKAHDTCKRGCFPMLKDTKTFKHVRRIENFSSLNVSCKDSDVFSTGAKHKWYQVLMT